MNIKKIFKIKVNSNLKSIIILGSIFFIASTLFYFLIIMHLKKAITNEYGKRAYSVADFLSKTLDVDKILKYKETLTIDDEYKEIVNKLDHLKSSLDLKYLYINSWGDNGETYCIYDATVPGDGFGENSTHGRVEIGRKSKSDVYIKKIVSNSELNDAWHEENNSYGHTISSYVPIKKDGKNVAFVGIDYSLNSVNDRLLKISLSVIITTQIMIILLFSLIIIFYKKSFSNPLKKITNIVKNFVSPDHDKINTQNANIDIKLEHDTDIYILLSSFKTMSKNIQKYVNYIKEITAEKQQIETELNIATQIQKSLIPHIFPAFPDMKELDIYASMKSARKVGGDFYDFFLINNNKLAFVIADVSGKGIAAALFMVIAKTLIKNEGMEHDDPATVMENVNKQLCVDNDLGMFITAFYGILDLKNGKLSYTNAGHMNPIAKFNQNNFEELKLRKQFVMAGMPTLKFSTESIQIPKGGILFLYTDGISEAQNDKSECWGKEKLIENLNLLDTDSINLKQVSELIMKKIKKFSNSTDQSDDITMLIIKYIGL